MPTAPSSGTSYVVQVRDTLETTGQFWRDVARITVPPKSPRRKVILQALNAAGIAPSEEPLQVRVLDEKSFEETPVEPYRPPAEWKL